MTPSCGRGDRSSLLQSAAKHCPSENKPPPEQPCFTLPNSHWTADTEGGNTRSWGTKAGDEEELRRSRGVLALIWQ